MANQREENDSEAVIRSTRRYKVAGFVDVDVHRNAVISFFSVRRFSNWILPGRPHFGITQVGRQPALALPGPVRRYDGTIHIQGFNRLPWHGVQLQESKLQHLPKFLRTHPCNYSRLQTSAITLRRRLRRLFLKT